MNSFVSELIVAMVLLILLTLLVNPFNIWMPGVVGMMLVLAVVLLFGLFAVFVWRERASDEREALHRMIAGRAAFLSGSAILLIGIVEGAFKHEINFWLPVTLGVMIFAKVAGLIYARFKN